MQKRLINKIDPQTIWDVLLQYGGAISGLFDFLQENDLYTIDIPEGEYIAPDIINEYIVQTLNPESKTIPVIVTAAPPSSTDFTTVTINGNNFAIWPANTTQNIELVNSENNNIDYSYTGNKVSVDDFIIQISVNGTPLPAVTAPVHKNITINLV